MMWIVSGVSDTGEKINLQSQRKVDIVLAIDDASVVDAAKEASDNNLQGALVYGIGNSTEAIYYLDSGWTEALITPDTIHITTQPLSARVSFMPSMRFLQASDSVFSQ